MILYLILSLLVTIGLCVLAYYFFSQQILQHKMKLDDGRGYYLIVMILVAFFCSGAAYFIGSLIGYDQTPAQQKQLTAAILLNAVIALLGLTYGLLKFREGEKY
ncbi:hypothetical protein [Bermanella sp. R86510]|uniref:hypothetical protein n=1 Tax=unclassified Bermanella TaxID=2627862 RepID=UPI0037CC3AD7